MSDLSRYLEGAGVSVDTRALAPGQLFVALRGERFDGHQFVAAALAAGAGAAVVEQGFEATAETDEARLVRVPSPLATLHGLAAAWRARQPAQVAAITGSVGKTTTKELLAALCGAHGAVLKTPGNANHEVGVPTALLRARAAHRFIVLELGMRARGQIRELGEMVRPDVAVITNAGEAHIGLLGSRRAIAEAKCELLPCIAPGGVAVLPAGDALLGEVAAQVWSGATVTFGLGAGAVSGELVAEGLRVGAERYALPLAGEHNALALLAALAAARALGVPWRSLTRAELELPPGRAGRVEIGGAVLLDESYNASPASMSALLRYLAAQRGRRVAVLGTMAELGEESARYHREIGALVRALGIDRLVALGGFDAAVMCASAAPVPSWRFDDIAPLTQWLAAQLAPGDVVLFKGARHHRLERAVAALAALNEASG